MTNGKAVAIFHEIDSDQYTELEKAEAIYRVIHMETHNGIRKEAMLKVIGYLWDLRSEALNCSETPNNSDLISRQAAIDALKAQLSKEGTTKDATSDMISKTETVERLRGMIEITVPITDYDGATLMESRPGLVQCQLCRQYSRSRIGTERRERRPAGSDERGGRDGI